MFSACGRCIIRNVFNFHLLYSIQTYNDIFPAICSIFTHFLHIYLFCCKLWQFSFNDIFTHSAPRNPYTICSLCDCIISIRKICNQIASFAGTIRYYQQQKQKDMEKTLCIDKTDCLFEMHISPDLSIPSLPTISTDTEDTPSSKTTSAAEEPSEWNEPDNTPNRNLRRECNQMLSDASHTMTQYSVLTALYVVFELFMVGRILGNHFVYSQSTTSLVMFGFYGQTILNTNSTVNALCLFLHCPFGIKLYSRLCGCPHRFFSICCRYRLTF
eukprot:635848_1